MAKGRPMIPGGGGNMTGMMKQIQKLQQEMLHAQDKVEVEEFVGTAGGGTIKATVNGKRKLLKVEISKDAVDPDDVETLEDLVMVAVNDALAKAEDKMEKTLSKYTNGLSMPGLF